MSAWRSSRLLINIPLLYCVCTRVASVRHFVYDIVVPLVPAYILVLSLSDLGAVKAAVHVGLAYLSFISFYELGYLVNDTYGTRNDETPRKRLLRVPRALGIAVFVTIRLVTWMGIGVAMNWAATAEWIGFFTALAVVLICHNMITSSAFKAVTFFQLSILRFVAPIIPSVPRQAFAYVVLLGIVFFTYNRFITYLDSKGRLRMPERKRKWYFVVTTGYFLPLVTLVALMARAPTPLILFACFIMIYALNALVFDRRPNFNGASEFDNRKVHETK